MAQVTLNVRRSDQKSLTEGKISRIGVDTRSSHILSTSAPEAPREAAGTSQKVVAAAKKTATASRKAVAAAKPAVKVAAKGAKYAGVAGVAGAQVLSTHAKAAQDDGSTLAESQAAAVKADVVGGARAGVGVVHWTVKKTVGKKVASATKSRVENSLLRKLGQPDNARVAHLTSRVTSGGSLRRRRRVALRKMVKGKTIPGRLTRRALNAAARAVSSMIAKIIAVIVAKFSVALIMILIICAIIAVVMALIASFIPSWLTGRDSDRQQSVTVAVPEEYADAVNRAGSICPEITPNLIAAQINQESGWNPNAVSGAGAQGISQFMPDTWASEGKDGNGDGKIDVMDPEDAIWSQGNYMCDQVAQVKPLIDSGAIEGDVVALALAAYNSGLGRVQSAGGIPAISETQNYVNTILAAASAGGGADEGGVSADIAEAVEWAKSVAADDSYAYVWGGNGKQDGGYDCSGLTSALYSRLGISLPRTAAQQQQTGTAVSREELKTGDLIFWGTPAYHVAVYAGDGNMVSADTEATGINYEPIYGSPSGYRRVQ
ncbi:C40 family peptidase [Actinomyces wuliandei]|uniref:C40 family peptidase n=1 Tax=Actinomyces wuliandei TaxID=2057743 RepID=UPI0015D65961|nr:bifunctional lytic transglycosylase/C40 family peptidase [Actinomyces wuliandei]